MRLLAGKLANGRGECQEGGEELKINGLVSVARGVLERERERESVILRSFIFFGLLFFVEIELFGLLKSRDRIIWSFIYLFVYVICLSGT